MTAMYVGPRSLRNEAGRTSKVMPLVSSNASAVRLAISCLKSDHVETGLRVVKNDLRYPLIERDAQQDTTLAGHQRISMIAEPRDVGGDCRYCFGLSASSPDHGGKLIDTLQRLALPAGQLGEDLALILI